MTVAAARQRCEELNGWVEECVQGLGHGARALTIAPGWEWARYKQFVLFEARDVERSNRSEIQDCVLKAVTKALREGIGGVRSRDGDPTWGWRVAGTKDLSADESVDRLGVRLWEPSMPKYGCCMVWTGPKPATWPHMMHLGQAENALSYPVGFAPTWR